MSRNGPRGRGVKRASHAPQRTRARSACSCEKSRSSVVLPTPASPCTRTSAPPSPASTPASASARTASSRSRSSSSFSAITLVDKTGTSGSSFRGTSCIARREAASDAARLTVRADVAELVDAHGSGPCGLRLVEVQVLSSASRTTLSASKGTGRADGRETDSNRRHQSERNLNVADATRPGKVARSERVGRR